MLRSHSHDMFAVWNEVTSRDAWNREAHLHMLGYLSPDECGSSAQMLDFLDGRRIRMPADSPATGVELAGVIGCHQRTLSGGGVNAKLTRHWWSQSSAAATLERSFTLWTRPGFLRHAAALADLNALAYGLVQAYRLSDSAKVFRMTGGTVTRWPWGLAGDPLQQYSYWRNRALRR